MGLIALFSCWEACQQPPCLGWARAAAGLLGLEVPTEPLIQKATVGFCSHRERYSLSLQGVKVDIVNTLGFIFDLVGHQSCFSPQVELPEEADLRLWKAMPC